MGSMQYQRSAHIAMVLYHDECSSSFCGAVTVVNVMVGEYTRCLT